MLHLPCTKKDSAEVFGVLMYTPHSSRTQLEGKINSTVKWQNALITQKEIIQLFNNAFNSVDTLLLSNSSQITISKNHHKSSPLCEQAAPFLTLFVLITRTVGRKMFGSCALCFTN